MVATSTTPMVKEGFRSLSMISSTQGDLGQNRSVVNPDKPILNPTTSGVDLQRDPMGPPTLG